MEHLVKQAAAIIIITASFPSKRRPTSALSLSDASLSSNICAALRPPPIPSRAAEISISSSWPVCEQGDVGAAVVVPNLCMEYEATNLARKLALAIAIERHRKCFALVWRELFCSRRVYSLNCKTLGNAASGCIEYKTFCTNRCSAVPFLRVQKIFVAEWWTGKFFWVFAFLRKFRRGNLSPRY